MKFWIDYGVLPNWSYLCFQISIEINPILFSKKLCLVKLKSSLQIFPLIRNLIMGSFSFYKNLACGGELSFWQPASEYKIVLNRSYSEANYPSGSFVLSNQLF